jgi:protein involved in polysaccharide export with SLBB domain
MRAQARAAVYAIPALLLIASAVSAQLPAQHSYLRPGDVLHLRVWPDTAMGGEFPVEDSGLVYLPFLGAVPVLDRPIGTLREELRRRYGEVLQNPVVTIIPRFRVSVLGEVVRPGLYHADPSYTLVDLVSLAGGFTAAANPRAVRLFRADASVALDVMQSLEQGVSHGVLLQSGDRIVVPRRSGLDRNLVLYALQLSTLVLAALTYVR